MIKHEHEESNKVNPERFNMLKKAPQFQKTDGLNNLKQLLIKCPVILKQRAKNVN